MSLALQPVVLPPDLLLLIIFLVWGLVVNIVVGIVLVIIHYAYRRSIQHKAARDGVYVGGELPSRKAYNVCRTAFYCLVFIVFCFGFIVVFIAPQWFFSLPLVFTVETMLMVIWGFVLFWAIGIPLLMIIITIVDCLWIRKQYLDAIGL